MEDSLANNDTLNTQTDSASPDYENSCITSRSDELADNLQDGLETATSSTIDGKIETNPKTILFRKFAARLGVAFGILLLATAFQGVCALLSDQFYKSGEAPLRDRVHELVGGHPPSWASGYVVNSLCALFTITTISRFVLFTEWTITFAIATRFVWCLAVMYIFRGIAITVTTLPCPLPQCVPMRASSVGEAIKVVFLMSIGAKYECTDMIVSGHTLFITALMMTWIYYSYKTKLSVILAVLFSVVIYAFIDISFFHYTIDIIMAVTLCVTVWVFYHLLVDIAAYQYKVDRLATLKDFQISLMRRYKIVQLMSSFVSWAEAMSLRMSVYSQQENLRKLSNQVCSASEKLQLLEKEDAFCGSNFVSPLKDEVSAPLISRDLTDEEEEENSNKFITAYIGNGTYDFSNFKALSRFRVRWSHGIHQKVTRI